MPDVELRYVRGHVEVYSPEGRFLFSADTTREALEELRESMAEEEVEDRSQYL